MKTLHRTLLQGAAALCVVAGGACMTIHADDPPKQDAKPQPVDAERVIDLRDASIPISVKTNAGSGSDGRAFMLGHTLKEAWAAKVASGNPRSPAAESGIVVAGSGGGHNVWGYDAQTGKKKWTDKSDDSGISDIVIGLGRAYYTTWSCTLEGVDIETGKHAFTKWLAPTVSCAPDTADELVACAYSKDGGYKVSLHNTTGGRKWIKSAGKSGVVHAPVVYEQAVYASTTDGKMQSFDRYGKKEWTADFGAVSAPVPTPWGLMVTTTWSPEEDGGASEDKPMTKEEREKWERGTVTTAEPLKGTVVAAKDRRVALIKDPTATPRGGKSKVKITGPRSSLDYQGVRPGVSNRNVIFAYGGKISCVNPIAGRAIWTVQVSAKNTEFATPLCHEGLVFVAGNDGVITALEEETGALVWSYAFKGQTFRSKPAADADRVFVTTGSGILLSLPIGIENIDLGRPRASGDGGVEGTASIYAKVQQTFRKVRNVVREVEEPEDMPGETTPDAERGERPEGGAPGPAPADDAARRDEDEAEEVSKGEWERREARKAERGRPNGRPYEKKPFKRD